MRVSQDPPMLCATEPELDETVIGHVPLDIRRMYVLAQIKANQLIDIGNDYKPHEDSDGSALMTIRRLSAEIEMLEDDADKSLNLEFMEVTRGEGSIRVCAGWGVAWSPLTADEYEECECEDEDGGQGPHKPPLSS